MKEIILCKSNKMCILGVMKIIRLSIKKVFFDHYLRSRAPKIMNKMKIWKWWIYLFDYYYFFILFLFDENLFVNVHKIKF